MTRGWEVAPSLSNRPHGIVKTAGGLASLPLAIGAAVAAPDRKVLSLNGDGAAAMAQRGPVFIEAVI